MQTIEREELKAELDAGRPVRLVMTMHQTHYDLAHIPGSVQLFDPETARATLELDDDIVVYCSDRACSASRIVGQKLIDAGYSQVRYYAGGLSDWQSAGYPLEGGAADRG